MGIAFDSPFLRDYVPEAKHAVRHTGRMNPEITLAKRRKIGWILH